MLYPIELWMHSGPQKVKRRPDRRKLFFPELITLVSTG
jgi:hypothetical protein